MIYFKENIFKQMQEDSLLEKQKEDLFRIKRVQKAKNDTGLLLKALRSFNKNKRISKTGSKGKRNTNSSSLSFTSFSGENKIQEYDKTQRCMIKMRYGNEKGAHKEFLKTYMKQENKEHVIEKPEYFGDDLASYEADMSGKHFKFIISPESEKVDLKLLTETLVKKMNKIFNTDLHYIAVVHTDTNHKHVHLLINGKDKNGKYINRFDRDFIKHTMRRMAEDICTKIAGYRTYEDIYNSKKNNYKKNRITILDKRLKLLAIDNFSSDKFKYRVNYFESNEELKKRLDYLCEINLAKRENKTYLLHKDWYEALEATGRYNTYLEARKEMLYKNKTFELYDSKNKIENAKVLKIYNMDDENVWNNAFIAETESKIYYVPLYGKVNRGLLNKNVNISKRIKDNKIILDINER